MNNVNVFIFAAICAQKPAVSPRFALLAVPKKTGKARLARSRAFRRAYWILSQLMLTAWLAEGLWPAGMDGAVATT